MAPKEIHADFIYLSVSFFWETKDPHMVIWDLVEGGRDQLCSTYKGKVMNFPVFAVFGGVSE